MAEFSCPGAAAIKGTPELKIKKCPKCGSDIEIFTTDISVECKGCGFVAYNDVISCAKWCEWAKECLGEEMYEIITGKNK